MPEELRLINDWLRDRSAGNSEQTVNALQSKFVTEQLELLRTELGSPEFSLVTVRSSFRLGSAYLRPVFSSPPSLTTFMEQGQRPFSFKGGRSVAFRGIDPERPTAESDLFVAVYQLTGETNEDRADLEFGPRIEGFWRSLGNSGNDDLLALRDVPLREGWHRYCFFSGRERKSAQASFELSQIVAAYFDSEKPLTHFTAALPKTFAACEALFNGLQIISASDDNMFRSEGRQLVADLLPEFSRREIAPADKIAFALERLKSLIADHLVGQHGRDQEPIVHYVSTSFEPEAETHLYHPHFRIYPHVYRRQPAGVRGAFLIGHRRVPSVAKLLLNKYLASTPDLVVEGAAYRASSDKLHTPPIEPTKEFESIFAERELQIDDEVAAVLFPGSRSDQLHVVSRDYRDDIPTDSIAALFARLNQQARAERDVHSVVAFVVEGAVIERIQDETGELRTVRQAPRGILAVESEASFAFSDNAVESMREIAGGFASLIRQISHDNSALDYRRQIREALGQQPDVHTDAGPMLSFIKMDGSLLRKLIDIPDLIDGVAHRYETANGGDFHAAADQAKTALRELANLVESVNDDSVRDEKMASRIIKRRRLQVRAVRNILAKLTASGARDIVEHFLEAVPENFVWSSYLTSIAQALGDRAAKSLPNFTAIQAGYSASNLFIAAIERELRQVVKLSGLANLEKERRNYLEFVRYRLPLAARIPVNAFAFDSIGELGQLAGARKQSEIGPLDPEQYNTRAYGALVSDLVSAQTISEEDGDSNDEGNVRTLMTVTADLVAENSKAKPNRSQVLNAIKEHFGKKSLSLWSVTSAGPNGYRADVRDSHRIKQPPAITFFDPRIVGAFSGSADAIGRIDSVYQGDYRTDDDQRASDNIGRRTVRGIIHADLNARNLSWSEAMDRFVLIDFEHVRYGIRLCDQTRLAINLVCDIYSNSLSRPPFRDPDTLLLLVDSVTSAISHLGDISKLLWNNRHGTVSLRRIVRSLDTRGESIVTDVMREILVSSDESSGRSGLESQVVWRQFLGYSVFGAALKEYQYSCNSLRAETDNDESEYVYDEGVELALLKIVKEAADKSNGAHSRLRDMLLEIGQRTLLDNADGAKLPTIRAGELARHLVSICVLLTVTPKVGLLAEPTVGDEPSVI